MSHYKGGGGNFGANKVKLIYFFKNLLLYSGALFRQTMCIVMITKEWYIKIGSFARACLYKSYSENSLFL